MALFGFSVPALVSKLTIAETGKSIEKAITETGNRIEKTITETGKSIEKSLDKSILFSGGIIGGCILCSSVIVGFFGLAMNKPILPPQ